MVLLNSWKYLEFYWVLVEKFERLKFEVKVNIF